MSESFLNGRVVLHHGDSRDVLKGLADNSIDSVVCDPPYALVSIVKRFGGANAAPAKGNDAYMRASSGFMGKTWDVGDTAFAVEFWAEVMRVLKPGGHVIAASGTRTYHRLAVAIEDAGYEIRDMLQYLYGSGFPKSHSVDKSAKDQICRCPQAERDLRPVREPNVSAPFHAGDKCGEVLQSSMPQRGASPQGWIKSSTSEMGGGQSGLEGRSYAEAEARELSGSPLYSRDSGPSTDGAHERLCDGAQGCDGADDRAHAQTTGGCPPSRSQSSQQRSGEFGIVAVQQEPQVGGAWPICSGCLLPRIPGGLGTALKPACEPWVLARKPLIGTVVANVLAFGTGAINIDGCRIESEKSTGWGGAAGLGYHGGCDADGGAARPVEGRFPANVIHDGSAEVLAAFPHTKSGLLQTHHQMAESENGSMSGKNYARSPNRDSFGDEGSAARFFYTAKADAMDRIGSKHPTVKPVDLMQYLCRLVTPPGGTVLDPFAGSGSTGEAAYREGFDCILIEREEEYCADIRQRLELCTAGEGTRKRAIATAKARPVADDGMQAGLFA